MPFLPGLSIFIHLAIIFFGKISRELKISFSFGYFRKLGLSYLIIFFVFTAVAINAFFSIKTSLKDNNLQVADDLISVSPVEASTIFSGTSMCNQTSTACELLKINTTCDIGNTLTKKLK